ncbi:MAG: DUF2997 domain-containing protein [Desulfovibrio sp.]|nr:DUF2997 domain-containing protein [Desulfovibrio sp.]
MRIVQITVTADGRVEMSTYGFPGKSCVEATKFMKDLLGEETFIKMKPTAFVPYVEKQLMLTSRNG